MEIRGRSPLSGIHPQIKALGSSPKESTWTEPEIMHDRLDANVRWNDASKTKAQVEGNRAREAFALSKLPSEQQSQYQAILKVIPENDPDARLCLQEMLLDGRLPGKKDLQGKGDLLKNLSTLSEQPMQADLAKERGTLVGDLIQEMYDPTCIAQKGKNTCGATTVQIILAERNPAEYVRLMGGLASPEGKAEAAGGTISRQPGTAADDGTNRSIGTRLMAPAFMDFANGGFSYDSASDSTDLKVMDFAGLVDFQVKSLASGILGEKYKDLMVGPMTSAEAALKEAGKVATPDSPVIASLTYGGDDLMGDGHYIQITGVKDGKVSYINPWGQVERMDEAQFKQHLISVLIPNQSAGILETAKNVVNTADMLKDMAGQQIEKSGILDKVEEKVESIKDQVVGFFKGLF